MTTRIKDMMYDIRDTAIDYPGYAAICNKLEAMSKQAPEQFTGIMEKLIADASENDLPLGVLLGALNI